MHEQAGWEADGSGTRRSSRTRIAVGAGALATVGALVLAAGGGPLAVAASAGGLLGAAASAAQPASGSTGGVSSGSSSTDSSSTDGWDPGSGPGGRHGWIEQGSASSVTSAQLSATAAAAAEEVTPSVVNIDTVVDYGSGEAAGTGIVIRSDGLVLTNHHVVSGATSIEATVVGTGKTYEVTVLGYDDSADIAVLKLTGASGLPVATIGDDVSVGDLVVGVGNAGGDGGEPTSVEGEVTAVDQTITATDDMGGDAETLHNLIEVSADIQSGQSGGPLVDASGEVVGVDVAASMSNRSSDTTGYAIPIDQALSVVSDILSGDQSTSTHIGGSAFLGVNLAQAGAGSAAYGYSASGGVTIAGTIEGSAAEAAGLATGDMITALDGRAITSADQLSELIARHSVGDRISLAWTDASGGEHRATVTLGEGPVG